MSMQPAAHEEAAETPIPSERVQSSDGGEDQRNRISPKNSLKPALYSGAETPVSATTASSGVPQSTGPPVERGDGRKWNISKILTNKNVLGAANVVIVGLAAMFLISRLRRENPLVVSGWCAGSSVEDVLTKEGFARVLNVKIDDLKPILDESERERKGTIKVEFMDLVQSATPSLYAYMIDSGSDALLFTVEANIGMKEGLSAKCHKLSKPLKTGWLSKVDDVVKDNWEALEKLSKNKTAFPMKCLFPKSVVPEGPSWHSVVDIETLSEEVEIDFCSASDCMLKNVRQRGFRLPEKGSFRVIQFLKNGDAGVEKDKRVLLECDLFDFKGFGFWTQRGEAETREICIEFSEICSQVLMFSRTPYLLSLIWPVIVVDGGYFPDMGSRANFKHFTRLPGNVSAFLGEGTLAEISYEGSRPVRCRLTEIYRDHDEDWLSQNFPEAQRVSLDEIFDIMRLCQETEPILSQPEDLESFWLRLLTGLFHDTAWCGPGNIAKNYSYLGRAKRTDACCRNHDLCPVKLNSWENKLSIRPGLRGMLHCRCEELLHECLYRAQQHEAHAKVLLALYFTVYGNDCIVGENGFFYTGNVNEALRQRREMYAREHVIDANSASKI